MRGNKEKNLMIFDDIADLFTELNKTISAEKIAKKFNRERKFVISMKNGCTFICNYDFICGLQSLGYDLKLVRAEK